MTDDSRINVQFVFPDGCDEEYQFVSLMALPRPGDIVCSHAPNSGKYRVKSVTHLIETFGGSDRFPGAAIEVALEPLDEIST